MIVSPTGSGKTGCFGLPMIQELSSDPFGVFGLVVTPSRELSLQMAEQLTVYGQSFNLRVTNLIGGLNLIQQSQQLDNIPHVVVGTPGRILQFLNTHSVFQQYFQNLRYCVLDEVDKLLETNLQQDVESILDKVPKEAKKILTSATGSQALLTPQLLQKLQVQTHHLLQVQQQQQQQQQQQEQGQEEGQEQEQKKEQKKEEGIEISTSIRQKYLFIPAQVSEYYLIELIKKYEGCQMIIFINKCKDAHLLNLITQKMGLESTVLHSLLSQKTRFINLKLFRNNKKQILFTTDISSRGLDIPNVDLVINKELPRSFKDYVHRIGRTGRNNKTGTTISFVTQFDLALLENIQDKTGQAVTEHFMDEAQVMKGATDIIKLKKKIEIFMSETGITKRFIEKKIIK